MPAVPLGIEGITERIEPNGVCQTGVWRITEPPPTRLFCRGRSGFDCGPLLDLLWQDATRRFRSLSLVGKLYPTTDRNYTEPLRAAHFITQQDIGGCAH